MSDSPNSVSPQALGELYRAHSPFVWRSLARLGVPQASLEDAMHDVFVVAARRFGEFRGDASPRTWLFAIAIRVSQSHRRTVARHLRKVEALEMEQADVGVAPSSAVEAQRTLSFLLEHLSDEQRQAFVLMEMEGMTGAEAAAALGVNPNTVTTRLRAARAKVKEAAAELLRATADSAQSNNKERDHV